MTYLDFDEQDEQAEANARIRDLRERRDYWMTRLSEGRNTEILNERVMFYVDYLDDLEQIPFANMRMSKKAHVIPFEAVSFDEQAAA